MNSIAFAGLRRSAAFVLAAAILAAPALRADDTAPVVVQPSVNTPVTVTDDGNTWTLDNGIVKI
ncbi:MAG: hypothetical protein ABSH19_08680, partial [Opitutales bacterium]